MKTNVFFYAFILCLIITSCGGGRPSDSALSYRLTIHNDDGEYLNINSSEFDAADVYNIRRMANYTWGIQFNGSDGISSVKLGLPIICQGRCEIDQVIPSDGPGRIIYNTGEPTLSGYQWQYDAHTVRPTFETFAVEGSLTLTAFRPAFDLLIRMENPDIGAELEHLIQFQTVK